MTTTFKVYVYDQQLGEYIPYATVKLKLGNTILQTQLTDKHGCCTFSPVTDGGSTDYHILVSGSMISGQVDKKVSSASTAGTCTKYVSVFVNRINKWAVIVGLGRWQDSHFSDTTGYKDANNWYLELKYIGFNKITTLGDDVSSYKDPNKKLATKSNILDAMNNAASKADNNDILVFIFAAHHSRLWGIACLDTKYYKIGTYLSSSTFKQIIKNTDAGQIFVWIHACHAEAFASSPSLKDYQKLLWMCSSKKNQVSFGDYFRKDFWNSANINFTSNPDDHPYGGIRLYSLEDIFNRMIQYYPKYSSDGKKMEPVMIDDSTEPFWLIGNPP
ncbi:MAG: caspase family protein [Candidatus Thorarchaeota archaeon]